MAEQLPPPEYISLYSADQMRAAIKATRAATLEEAARECDEMAADQMEQARGGDNSGASDHRADAAEMLAYAIRALIGKG